MDSEELPGTNIKSPVVAFKGYPRWKSVIYYGK
jgi:hypothetical protein